MDGSKHKQNLSTYKREDKLILSSNIKTLSGFWYLREPFVVLDTQITSAELGLAAFDALARYQTGLSEPPDQETLNETQRQLLKAAGVQSYADLLEGALHCVIGRTDSEIEITPTHNGGEGKGFNFLLDHQLLLKADAEAETLGAAFLAGFAACTSVYE